MLEVCVSAMPSSRLRLYTPSRLKLEGETETWFGLADLGLGLCLVLGTQSGPRAFDKDLSTLKGVSR